MIQHPHLALPPLDVDGVSELGALLDRNQGTGALAHGRQVNLRIDVESRIATTGRPDRELDIIVFGVAAGEGAGDGELGGSLLQRVSEFLS